MIVPKAIQDKYSETVLLVEIAGDRVYEAIQPFCFARHYLVDRRIKSLESVAEKIESGRYSSWREIDDLFACMIVVPSPADEVDVVAMLKEKFETRKLIQRGQIKKPPDTFRFDSTRFVGRLRDPRGFVADEPRPIYQVLFEIQIQTAFEYAWTKTTHSLVYKSGHLDWKRLRLAAQLKAAVEQLDMLIAAFDGVSDAVSLGNWPAIDDKSKIHSFFVGKVEEGCVPTELAPKDWSRFCDNVYRILQVLQGHQSPSQGGRKLRILEDALGVVDVGLGKFSVETFPRSVSLFQTVLGILCESSRFTGKSEDYFVMITDELRMLFPNIVAPGPGFVFPA